MKNKIKTYKPQNELEKAVLNIIVDQLDRYDKADDFFNDLLSHGCQSGMIGEMIYYVDTHKWTKTHLEDIMELVDDTEAMLGEPLKIEGDRLNWLAWFSFEETARKIYESLGGEL